jgi:acyl-CoA thioester hydrolase
MKVILPLRVIAFETDYAGVVSNTRYIEYLERGRYALLQAAGFSIERVLESHGVQAVVRRIDIEYLRAARHEDDLELHVAVKSHSGATSTIFSQLFRVPDNALLMRATQTLAYTDRQMRAVRVPQIYRDALLPEIQS